MRMTNLHGLVVKLVTFGKNSQKSLKAKLDKALQPKVNFSIDASRYDMPSHNPCRRYNFVEKGSNRKSHLLITYIVIIVAKRVILLQSASLGNFLFLKVPFNGFINATKVSLILKDPIKIGYLAFFVDLAG